MEVSATDAPWDAASLLALWERGLCCAPVEREDALLGVLADGAAPARTLGERNARLVALHARMFGRHADLLSHCPSCGTAAQFQCDCDALSAQISVTDRPSLHRLEAGGHVIEFRVPDRADLVAASADDTPDLFVERLLGRCVIASTRDGSSVSVSELPEPVLDALSQRMEALDPGARLSFVIECPQCATTWDASLDVGQLVWQKVQASAERLLLDIDALARAYGWTERDVLNLSPLRRAAYLQLVAS
jgi:hypothetical protein